MLERKEAISFVQRLFRLFASLLGKGHWIGSFFAILRKEKTHQTSEGQWVTVCYGGRTKTWTWDLVLIRQTGSSIWGIKPVI